MKKLKGFFAAAAFLAFFGGAVATVAVPQPAMAAGSAADCSERFLTFPTWFRGLVAVDAAGECRVIGPAETPPGESQPLGLGGYVWRLALNVIEIALQVVGYIAVGFILYGGFQYLTNGSNPSVVESAKMTLINAAVGLVISIASVAVVNLVFGLLG